MVQSLPTAKGYAGLMVLIPSMVQSGGGVPNVQLSPGMVVFGGRGGRGNEGRAQVDGLNTGASLNGGGVSGYRQDVENAPEIAITTAGGLGETEVGGPTMNIVPRTGGNTLPVARLLHRPEAAACRRATTPTNCRPPGLRTPAKTNYIYDTSFSIGGPIMQGSRSGSTSSATTAAARTHPGHVLQQERMRHPTKWSYEADTSRPARVRRPRPAPADLRLTFQVSSARQAESVLGRADQQQQPRRRNARRTRRRPAAATTAGSACSR